MSDEIFAAIRLEAAYQSLLEMAVEADAPLPNRNHFWTLLATQVMQQSAAGPLN